MKKYMKAVVARITLFLLALFTGITYALAQSQSSSVTTTTTSQTQTWYTQPWVWIVGGAVFILILMALVRGGNKDSVTITKTTSTERDV
jgi:hypothetical protein